MANKENLPIYVSDSESSQHDESKAISTRGTIALSLWNSHTALFDSPRLPAFSPRNRPSLSAQRDHSTCSSASSPLTLRVRKTRENLRVNDLKATVPPPCLHLVPHARSSSPPDTSILTEQQIDVHPSLAERQHAAYIEGIAVPQPSSFRWPTRQGSAGRRMLHKVRESLSGRPRSQQSNRVSECDVSLVRRLSEKWKDCPDPQTRAQSLEINKSPPHLDSRTALQTPFVELRIHKDREMVPATTAGQFVLTAVATVQLKHAMPALAMQAAACGESSSEGLVAGRTTVGCITSLRLCFKPSAGCTVLETEGQKIAKDLCPGQQVILRISVHIPKVDLPSSTPHGAVTQDVLTTELESMLGILHTDALAVEAKYRHSLLAADNVTTVRQTCSMRRPNTECIWSMTTHSPDVGQDSAAATIVQSMQPALVVTHVDQDVCAQDGTQDSARLIWQNMRRSSVSTNSHLRGGHAGGLERLGCSEAVRALREKALANKRSVGAETLMEWQWDERRPNGETPWL